MTNATDNFPEMIKAAPRHPGVYRMFDASGDLLYVGKARDLRARLSQYTDINKLEWHKRVMRSLVARVEWVLAPTESDALVMEERAIKAEHPKYNIIFTDGKMYPYLTLTKHPFPRLTKIRGKLTARRDVFGPYPSVSALNDAIKTIQKVAKIRTCTDSYMRNRTRPCILYQIGRCSAPCVYQSPEYADQVAVARQILSGDASAVANELSVEMQTASDRQEYELAAEIRDRIAALSTTAIAGKRKTARVRDLDWGKSVADLEKYLNIKIARADVFDNSHLFTKNAVGAMIVFGRDGFIKNEYRRYKLRDKSAAGNDIGMMREFLTRAYSKTKSSLAIVDGGIAQWNIAQTVMRELNLNIPILGVTKGTVRDGDEHFILPDGRVDMTLPKDSDLFLLLRRVRDEAHRFVITYHRRTRDKAAIASRLDEIDGIGAARKRALLHRFGTVVGVANASARDLARVDGVSAAIAKKIYYYFHPDAIE